MKIARFGWLASYAAERLHKSNQDELYNGSRVEREARPVIMPLLQPMVRPVGYLHILKVRKATLWVGRHKFQVL